MQFFLVSLVVVVYLIYIIQMEYRDYKIVGITFSREDSKLPQVRDSIKKEKIRQGALVLVVIILSFLMRNIRYADLVFFTLLFLYIFIFYFSFRVFVKELKGIKKSENISYGKEKRKVNSKVSRTIGDSAPDLKYIWIIWSLSFIPLFLSLFSKRNEFIIIDILVPLVLIVLPLGYKSFINQKTLFISDDYLEDIKYRNQIDYKNGLMYLILSLETIIFCIAIKIVLLFAPSNIYLILGLVVLFLISMALLVYYFNKDIKKSQDRIKGEVYINEDDSSIKWGMYYNPNDSRVIVPKISGLGTTINIGHPLGKVMGIALISLLIISIVLVFVSVLMDMEVSLSDQYIEIKAPLYNYEIEYSNIEFLEINDKDLRGQRTNGYGGESKAYGYFNLDDYGDVRLYQYKHVDSHIDIYEVDGSITIFNLDSIEKTENIYDQILNRIE